MSKQNNKIIENIVAMDEKNVRRQKRWEEQEDSVPNGSNEFKYDEILIMAKAGKHNKLSRFSDVSLDDKVSTYYYMGHYDVDFQKNTCKEVILFQCQNFTHDEPYRGWDDYVVLYILGTTPTGKELFCFADWRDKKVVLSDQLTKAKSLKEFPSEFQEFFKENDTYSKMALEAKNVDKKFLQEYEKMIEPYQREAINIPNFGTTSMCDLENIDDDCPWKKYEGLSVSEFIKTNFAPLNEKFASYIETMVKNTQEIAFIKKYHNELQRDYWFCVYALNSNEEDGVEYIIGGEPEIPTPSEHLQDKGWSTFPQELLDLYLVHGVIQQSFDEEARDVLSLENLRNNFDVEFNAKLPHHSKLFKVARDMDANFYGEDGYCVNFMKLPDGSTQWPQGTNDEEFVDEYLMDAIFFANGTESDEFYFTKKYKQLPQMYLVTHEVMQEDEFMDFSSYFCDEMMNYYNK